MGHSEARTVLVPSVARRVNSVERCMVRALSTGGREGCGRVMIRGPDGLGRAAPMAADLGLDMR